MILAELLFGLESGQMTREQVVAGAKAELEQVLKALSMTAQREASACFDHAVKTKNTEPD